MKYSTKQVAAKFCLSWLAIHSLVSAAAPIPLHTLLPIALRPAFCGDADNALRSETASHELSLAYSTALLIDLQNREQTQARSTRDALADMRAEYCPGRRDGK